MNKSQHTKYFDENGNEISEELYREKQAIYFKANTNELETNVNVTKVFNEHFEALNPGYGQGTTEPTKQNPKDLLGIKKPQLNLVPASSILYQALAMEDGAVKYGPYNWREKNVKASIYIDAATRHLQLWFDSREENAFDSKKPHLGHALACIGIIVDALENKNLVDDRPPAGPISKLIEKWTKK